MVARAPDAPGATAGPAGAPKPAHQRPELPDFWDHRFERGVTPWDAGRTPEQFARFAERLAARRPRTLIPGCGSAWEAALLDGLGWPVCALDFSAAAIKQAQRILTGFKGELVCADFFTHAPATPYGLVYERAFLCALPRALWPAYAPRVAELLEPGGQLAGYFFIDADALRGPPFGIAEDALFDLLSPRFELVERAPASDSIGPFSGREHWMVWRRMD